MRVRYAFVVLVVGLILLMMGSGPPEYGGEAVCGDGVMQPGEQCDGGTCCATSCMLASAATMCRASMGSCDLAEACTGTSPTCPVDAFRSGACGNACSSGTCVSGRCVNSIVQPVGTFCYDTTAASCIGGGSGSGSGSGSNGGGTCDGFGNCTLRAPY